MKTLKLLTCMLFVLTASIYNPAHSQEQSNSDSKATTETIKIKVKGVTCSSDLKRISANVEKVNGVSKCRSIKQGSTSVFEVQWNTAVANRKEVNEAIETTVDCEDPNKYPYKVKQK